MSASVEYFRARRPGPESRLEDSVVSSFPDLFGSRTEPIWLGGSIPVGAGEPDLVWASYRSGVARTSLAKADAWLLGYLRGVRGAKLETVVLRTHRPIREIQRRLERLVASGAVLESDGVFRMASEWRDILPQIIAVEVKVSDWRRANQQALRNYTFAHQSFVALPEKTAHRVRSAPEFAKSGVGVIATCDSMCRVIRPARRRTPMVWSQYYLLAAMIGQSESICAV